MTREKLLEGQSQRRKICFLVKEKVGPETSVTVAVLKGGLLTITYIDRRKLLIYTDHSEILIASKSGPSEEGTAFLSL